MKKRNLTLIILIFMIFIALIPDLKSQDNDYESKYELGFGLSLLGSGDIPLFSIMNEIDYSIAKRLELSMSFGLGKGLLYDLKWPSVTSTFQLNTNLFFIPLIIRNKYKFKLGTGFSIYNLNEGSAVTGYYDPDGHFVITDYYFTQYTTYGFNVLIENELLLYKNISAAFLLFFQRYQNRDTNAGGMLKMGYNF